MLKYKPSILGLTVSLESPDQKGGRRRCTEKIIFSNLSGKRTGRKYSLMSTLREGRNSLFSAFFIVKNTQEEKEKMNVTLLAQGSVLDAIGSVLKKIDDFVWGVPLIVLILAAGLFLTIRLGFLQIRHLPKALKFMVKNEKGGDGEVSSFGALCTAMSATIGTGNIVGVATALVTGGPGALFWMSIIQNRPRPRQLTCIYGWSPNP